MQNAVTGSVSCQKNEFNQNSERLKQNPQDADAYHKRGHALLEMNRLSEAIDDFSRAIRLRPDDAHLLDVRGRVHAALKHCDLARIFHTKC